MNKTEFFEMSERLKKLVDSFDLPDARRDLRIPGNIPWLLRNIQVRNAHNPELSEAISLLKRLHVELSQQRTILNKNKK